MSAKNFGIVLRTEKEKIHWKGQKKMLGPKRRKKEGQSEPKNYAAVQKIERF